MAENKENKVIKYKFGQDDLNLKDYIYNLKGNVDSYLNSRNWDEGQKQEFINSYKQMIAAFDDQLNNNTNRFSSDEFGNITDNEGVFTNNDGQDFYYNRDGKQITQDEYNQLKKRKQKGYQDFSATTEVANYFKRIGNDLKTKIGSIKEQKPESITNKFDLVNNGFQNTWIKQNFPNYKNEEIDLSPYWDQDTANSEGIRGTTNRASYLANQLKTYLQNLDQYDYSDSTFKDKAAYEAAIQEAINSLETEGYSNQDRASLYKIGISKNFLDNFFYDGSQQKQQQDQALQGYTPEQIATLEQAQTLQEENQRKETVEAAQQLIYENNLNNWIKEFQKKNPFTSRVNLNLYPYTPSYDKDQANENFINIYNGDISKWVNNVLQRRFLEDPDKNKVIRSGKEYDTKQHLVNNLDWIVNTGGLQWQLGDNLYGVPYTVDTNRMALVTYNPTTRVAEEKSLFDYINNPEIKKIIDDIYKKSIQSNKEGGILKLQYGGVDQNAINNYIANYNNTKKKEEEAKKAKEKSSTSGRIKDIQLGRSKEEIESGQRTLSDGLTWTDYVRLGSIAADLTSAISSYVPGYGTLVSGVSGIGSTTANLVADIGEDGFQMSDLGNFAAGLGMDVIGLIPGFGTAGKAAKISKTLVRYAPYVLGGLQAANALSEPSLASWGKIMDGRFKDLTVDDLRNIAAGITAFTSLNNQIGTRLKASAMKTATKTGDNLISDKTGEMLRISPEKLKEIQNAKTLEEANKILQSIPGYEKKELASHFRSWWNPKRLIDHNPSVADHYDWSKLRGTEFDKKGLSDARMFKIARTSNLGNLNWHLKMQNPYYKKYLDSNKPKTKTQSNPKSKKLSEQQIQKLRSLQTNKLTPEDIKLINYQRKLSGKPKLTEQEIKELQSRVSRTNISYPKSLQERFLDFKQNGKQNNWTVENALDELKNAKTARQVKNEEVQKSIEANARKVRTEQLIELAERIKSQRIYTPVINKPLQGAARTAKEHFYSQLFNKPWMYNINTVTTDLDIRPFIPKVKKPMSEASRAKKQALYERLFPPQYPISSTSTMPKSEKGLKRQERKQKELEELIEKQRINAEPYVSKSKLKSKKQKKQKKTSRDDKVTRKEQGGTLNISKVRKFQNAGTINYNFIADTYPNNLKQYLTSVVGNNGVNNISKSDKYTFSTTDRLNSMLDRLEKNKITTDDISEMQKRHWGMYTNWNPVFLPSKNNIVKQYQIDYQTLGLNDEIISPGYKTNYIINSKNPNSGDNIGNWTADGLFSQITDDRRVLARESDYKDNPELLKRDIELAKSKGYDYYLDPDTKYYMLKPIEQKPQEVVEKTEVKASNEDGETGFQWPALELSPTLTYGLPRALYADRMNRKITDLAKESITPLLSNPFQIHRLRRSGKEYEDQGQQNYARLKQLAETPLTSRAEDYQALQLETELKGLDAINAGNQQSNQVYRQTDELAWQQEKENAQNRHNTAQQNRGQMWATDQQKLAIEQAYLSKKHNIWDTFWQQLELEARQKQQETKGIKQAFAMQDIENNVNKNLKEYAPQLSDQAINLLTQLENNTIKYSDLTSEQQSLVLQAKKAKQEAIYNEQKKYWGLPVYNQFSKPIWNSNIIVGAKDGTKIEVAKIKAKVQDADRFQKNIQKYIDRHEKVLDRFSKSINNYIKKVINDN